MAPWFTHYFFYLRTAYFQGGNDDKDYVVVDLGQVVNTGQRDAEEDNTITVQVKQPTGKLLMVLQYIVLTS